MNPIFKNSSDAALALSKLILAENLSDPVFTFISPDAQNFCQLIVQQLHTSLVNFSDIFLKFTTSNFRSLIILDDASTRATEFIEFTDLARQKFPQSQIIVAIPFVPQSEESVFKNNSDRLLTLHVEPLFFSPGQFYQQANS